MSTVKHLDGSGVLRDSLTIFSISKLCYFYQKWRIWSIFASHPPPCTHPWQAHGSYWLTHKGREEGHKEEISYTPGVNIGQILALIDQDVRMRSTRSCEPIRAKRHENEGHEEGYEITLQYPPIVSLILITLLALIWANLRYLRCVIKTLNFR